MTAEIAIQETEPTFPPTLEKIEAVEARLLDLPQVNCPLKHQFAPGVYFREVFMPKGTFVIGHEHQTEHFNVVLSGKASVLCDGVVMDIAAPHVFVSQPGVRKILYIKEDMRWATVHPTTETDLDILEPLLIRKSAAFENHAQAVAALKAQAEKGEAL